MGPKFFLMNEAGDDGKGGGGGGADDKNKPPAITPEQFAELTATAKRLEAANKKLSDDYAAAQSKIKEIEKAKLEGAGDFKKLWDDERSLREAAEAKLTQTKSSFVLTQKHFAAKEALVKAGLNPEALKMLDKETFDTLDVAIHDDRFEVKGTETLVAQWKQDYPFLFKTASNPPNVNSGGTGAGGQGGGGKDLTAGDVFEIERKFGQRSKEYKEAVVSFAAAKAKKSANR